MKKMLLMAGVAATIGFAATGAQAALSIVGGTAGTIPGGATNSNAGLTPLGFVNPLGGFYGAQLSSAAGRLTFEFLGFEAGDQNRFRYNNGQPNSFTFDTETLGNPNNQWSAAGFTSQTRDFGGGIIPFLFSNKNFNAANVVNNGSNPFEDPTDPKAVNLNFFISIGVPPGSTTAGGPTSGNVAYLWFDDRGGNRDESVCGPKNNKKCTDDDNHDDMVVRVTFTPIPVPEPATLALFGAGLLGLGVAARRRRKV